MRDFSHSKTGRGADRDCLFFGWRRRALFGDKAGAGVFFVEIAANVEGAVS